MIVEIGILVGLISFIILYNLFLRALFEVNAGSHDCHSLDELSARKQSIIHISRRKLDVKDIEKYIKMWTEGKLHKTLKSLVIFDIRQELFRTKESLKQCSFYDNIFETIPASYGFDNDDTIAQCFKVRQDDELSEVYMRIEMTRHSCYVLFNVYKYISEEDCEDSD